MRLIDADALKDHLKTLEANSNNSHYKKAMQDMVDDFFSQIIDAQPTVDAEQVRYGHWEKIPGMDNTVFCSECLAAANKELAMRYKGCPFCLARMNGGSEDDE